MIPTGGQLANATTETQQPSRTWKLDFETGRVVGLVEGLEAIRQSVIKILQTERYDHAAYSFDYGIELRSLIGKGPAFAKADLRRRIEEALRQDEHVRGISNLSTQGAGDQMEVSFTVLTDYGSIDIRQEVRLSV